MSPRHPIRPSKTQQWPAEHGKIMIYLKPSDRVLFRKVTDRGFPESLGRANVGKKCTVIFGHKEVEGLQESPESGPIEMFTGQRINVQEEDRILTCVVDPKDLLSSVGFANAGKITIILHLQEPHEIHKCTEMEDKLKKLKDDHAEKHEQLSRMVELINELEKE